jgi:hypothetical protein
MLPSDLQYVVAVILKIHVKIDRSILKILKR